MRQEAAKRCAPKRSNALFSHFLLLGLLLLGMAIRWGLWAQYRFREDEALYAYWAWLIFSGLDVMLNTAPVDKPPLFPYTLAWFFKHFGPSEAAAQLPSLLASSLSLPLLYAWARDLFHRDVAWRALLLYATMPLAVLMAPTAYTDSLMVGWALLATWAAQRQRPAPLLWALLSGLALGAAVTTKPFAVLWVPLVVGLAWARGHLSLPWLTGWLAGWAFPLWRWWAWERLREAPSTLTLGLVHYGGVGIAPPQVWARRAWEWAQLTATTWGGAGFLSMMLFLGLGGMGWLAYRRGMRRADVVLVGWALLVWAGYVVSTLAVWDRYILVLAPVWAVLVARGWSVLAPRKVLARWQAIIVVLALAVGIQAGRAAFPVGGDHGAYDGVDVVSAYIMRELPPGGVVYHHWLGWHYGFYLFGAPYDYRWWKNTDWLARDAATNPGLERVVVFPAWEEATRQQALALLRASDVQPVPVMRVYSPRTGKLTFYLYKLEGPPSP